MKPARIALGGLVLVVLAGVWLFAAPFGLAYQPLGAKWTTATLNDLATGGALVLIGAVALIAYASLATRDLMARAKGQPATEAGGPTAGSAPHAVVGAPGDNHQTSSGDNQSGDNQVDPGDNQVAGR